MYLLSLTLRFETKILDIAYLLLLKLMKEPSFRLDRNFGLLYIKILAQQQKIPTALDFIDMKPQCFDGNKLEKIVCQAQLFHQQGKDMLAIGLLFNLLR